MRVLDYSDYRKFLREYLKNLPNRGHGQLARIAQALDIHPSIVTLVVKEKKDFTLEQASDLAELFKVLANDTRLHLLHAIVQAGERCVTDLAEDAGLSVQAVSNQLARLTENGVVATRRDGSRIHYRVVDPCVPTLLYRGLCLVEEARKTRPRSRKAEARAAHQRAAR